MPNALVAVASRCEDFDRRVRALVGLGVRISTIPARTRLGHEPSSLPRRSQS
jgi:hypothetical protein